MKLQSPPGMRDFYPEDMRRQNWLFDQWRRVSESFGFSEYEGPIFEYLALYQAKSGPGIVSELFNFEDRGNRRFAIRPEMTPTLARMVAARANALPRPIKWYSLPRMCRAERPQRGRLREFFQWNIDILGIDDVLADAEVIAVAASFLQRVGLSPDDVVIRVSDRHLAAAALRSVGVPEESLPTAFQLVDRFDKLAEADFAKAWDEGLPDTIAATTIAKLLTETSRADCIAQAARLDPAGEQVAADFDQLWRHLAAFNVAEYCEFDLRTVRGLAYYTGPVFEVWLRSGQLRALFGGGRYDNLTEILGGPRVTGVGFGAGDVPILEALAALDRLPETEDHLDVFVIDAAGEHFPAALDIVNQLRAADIRADFSYKRQNVGKQLKQATGRGARYAVIVGQELVTDHAVALKNLTTGEQSLTPINQLPEHCRQIHA